MLAHVACLSLRLSISLSVRTFQRHCHVSVVFCMLPWPPEPPLSTPPSTGSLSLRGEWLWLVLDLRLVVKAPRGLERRTNNVYLWLTRPWGCQKYLKCCSSGCMSQVPTRYIKWAHPCSSSTEEAGLRTRSYTPRESSQTGHTTN